MISWRIALGAVVVMVAVSFAPLVVHAGAVALPQTGITKCLDGAGLEIPCMGTGQDGELRAGAAWPVPRFTDNGDGTLLDNLTGLAWTVDAGTPTAGSCTGGAKNWQEALDYIACLNSTGYLGRTDWRLPNINELESLLNSAFEDPRPWLGSQGFVSVGTGYWTSTTSTSSGTGSAWYLDVSLGYPSNLQKTVTKLVWPVRQPSAGNSQVWRTGQTTSYSAGDDGALRMGAAWPSPRLNPNNDGTVIDRLTGLIWPQDASTPAIALGTFPQREGNHMKSVSVLLALILLPLQGTHASAQGRLPPCPRSIDTATLTNCVGELQTSPYAKYVGEFKGGKPNGQGTLTTTGGAEYVGEWRNGEPNGQGAITHFSGPFAGQKYVGGFRSGMYHGQGIEYRADGSVQRSGIWRNGAYVGAQ